MKIILLSGGSGKRLWPLSNDSRSKQFLQLLTSPDGSKESMIQRVVRQIKESGLTDDIVVATAESQKTLIDEQLGGELSVVTEPCRRDTFPAILLACAYLKEEGTPEDEPVVVMPCDTYTKKGYFQAVAQMAEAVKGDVADMVLMGIRPTYPSAKYGYIVPEKGDANHNDVMRVKRFTEKPDVATAEQLIEEGALWNGGVFAFKLGYLLDVAKSHSMDAPFEEIRANYADLTKISFDYAVVEKATSVAVVPYAGAWKDLGTWNTLTDELKLYAHGKVYTEDCEDTYIINELDIPVVCLGGRDLIVAVSADGILISERKKSENIKHIVDGLGS